ncbi:MAG: hypothetical protein ABI306_02925 [Caulobacteraceae bacterium]
MISNRRFARGLLLAASASLLPAAAMAERPAHPGGHVGPMLAPYTGAPPGVSGTWTKVTAPFPGASPETALLLTDGTVLMHDQCTPNWYRLTPDATGGYVGGSWLLMATLPAGYSPLYYASSVLLDGRLIVNGGEYNGASCSPAFTKLGALYDPVANSWTSVPAPSGWGQIGDAASVVLPNGDYMLQTVQGKLQAIGVVAPLPATSVTWTPTGTGKADSNDEEGWTPLAIGDVLTVDANRSLGANSPAELYSPSTGAWVATGTAPSPLVDPGSHEIGPAIRLPDGNVYQSGSSSCSLVSCVGHTALYAAATGTWTAGPDFPAISGGQYDVNDGPAAILPGGNVLVQASPGYACGSPPSPFCAPSHFFEYNGTTLVRVNEPVTAPMVAAYQGRMLVLPTGQILWSAGQAVSDVEIYTPKGAPKKAWEPVVKHVSATLTRGQANYVMSGKRFHGVSNGAAYGDDAQMASNYPMVRITNVASGHVCFARMHDHADTHARFDMPAATPPAWEQPCDTGPSNLQAVVNGIASSAVAVTVQ